MKTLSKNVVVYKNEKKNDYFDHEMQETYFCLRLFIHTNATCDVNTKDLELIDQIISVFGY